jgi:hypothetical protein
MGSSELRALILSTPYGFAIQTQAHPISTKRFHRES